MISVRYCKEALYERAVPQICASNHTGAAKYSKNNNAHTFMGNPYVRCCFLI